VPKRALILSHFQKGNSHRKNFNIIIILGLGCPEKA